MSGKYAKFDSFLKRTLDNKKYKDVKIYEPCVINSTREKHAFRFTFLTTDRIYITENPPKTLLYSIHLKDVVDVFMLHDKANFLQADLRNSVHHVVVKYISVKDETTKGASKSSDTVSEYLSTSSSYLSPQSSGKFNGSKSRDGHSSLLCTNTNVVPFQNQHQSLSKSSQSEETQLIPQMQSSTMSSSRSVKTMRANAERPRRSPISWTASDAYAIHVLLTTEGTQTDAQIPQELHLYILNENTTYLLMLQSIWRNFLIFHGFPYRRESGASESLSTIDFPGMDHHRKSSSGADDNTRKLFSDLKQELQFAQSIEQIYGLFNELKTAVVQDLLIKFLFWKDDILIKLSISLMKKCLESSSMEMDERADEIELCILITQTIAAMLRETEAIPQCYRVLQNLSLPNLKVWVGCLLSAPQLSIKSWHSDRHLTSLTSEFTVAATELVYELIIASQQVSWIIQGKSTVFCGEVFFRVIRENQHLCHFLDRLMKACVRIWNSNSEPSLTDAEGRASLNLHSLEALTPEYAVQAFRLFTAFHRIITTSNMAAQHARDHFKEEFKYYIHPESLPGKFPQEYAISGMARSVVSTLGSFITGVVAK